MATTAFREAAERALEAGRLLIEAKGKCRHDEWLPFLERANDHERQARRLMQLARSGLKPDTVSDLGIKGALELLAKWKLPDGGHVLQVTAGPLARDGGNVWIWESEPSPGYFHLAGMGRDLAFAEATRKPISGSAPEHIFEQAGAVLERRYGELRFATLPPWLRQPCEAFRAAVIADHEADDLTARACELVEQANARLAAF